MPYDSGPTCPLLERKQNDMKKSKNMEEGNYIALAKEYCLCCGKEMDGPILLAHNLNSDIKSKAHGKIIGPAPKLCDECQKGVDMGAVMISIIDSEKSDKNDINGVFRCGIVTGVKREAFNRMIEASDDLKFKYSMYDFESKHHFIFMDYRIAEQFGFPVDSYKEYLKTH